MTEKTTAIFRWWRSKIFTNPPLGLIRISAFSCQLPTFSNVVYLSQPWECHHQTN